MSPYTTRDVVRAALARTEDSYPGTAASLSDDEIDAAIIRAGGLIDSRLGIQYVVPFTQVPLPVIVVRIAVALAAFDADQTFREVRDYSSDLNPVYLRYTEAMKLLDQLAKGTATLPDYEPPDDGSTPTDPPGGNIIDVINPDLCAIWPKSGRADPSSPEHWSQW